MSAIVIYQSSDKQPQIDVKFDGETVWLSQKQIAVVFGTEVPAINKHIKNIVSDGELAACATISKMEIIQTEGKRKVKRNIEVYNLDMILSVGYRVNSARATQFRIWATQRLKDFLVQGYAINTKRLEQKQQEVEHLKNGIRIISRVVENEVEKSDHAMLKLFAKGLELLDDYDHEALDSQGRSDIAAVYPEVGDYLSLIADMHSDFESDVFAKPKDDSFSSSVNQIRQSFGEADLYPSLEEKAANLLYFIVKNHSFVDGNKRIAAACFLYFLEQNHLLLNHNNSPIISNEALASLTLFIASSKREESDTVKKLIISILNRSRTQEVKHDE
jgi:prophage maintenance system killer protein